MIFIMLNRNDLVPARYGLIKQEKIITVSTQYVCKIYLVVEMISNSSWLCDKDHVSKN